MEDATEEGGDCLQVELLWPGAPAPEDAVQVWHTFHDALHVYAEQQQSDAQLACMHVFMLADSACKSSPRI